jgi:hypothetical protein
MHTELWTLDRHAGPFLDVGCKLRALEAAGLTPLQVVLDTDPLCRRPGAGPAAVDCFRGRLRGEPDESPYLAYDRFLGRGRAFPVRRVAGLLGVGLEELLAAWDKDPDAAFGALTRSSRLGVFTCARCAGPELTGGSARADEAADGFRALLAAIRDDLRPCCVTGEQQGRFDAAFRALAERLEECVRLGLTVGEALAETACWRRGSRTPRTRARRRSAAATSGWRPWRRRFATGGELAGRARRPELDGLPLRRDELRKSLLRETVRRLHRAWHVMNLGFGDGRGPLDLWCHVVVGPAFVVHVARGAAVAEAPCPEAAAALHAA